MMRPLSIRTLLAVVLVSTVAPLLFYTVRTLSSLSEVSRVRAQEAALGAAAAASGVVELFLSDTEYELDRLRESLDDGILSASTCKEQLALATLLDAHALNFLFVDRRGDLVCSGVPELREVLPNLSHQVWYQRVRDGMEFSVGIPVRGVREDNWLITLALPIVVDGEFRGAVGKVVDLVEFQEVLQFQALGIQGTVLSITEDSLLVSRSEGGAELLGVPLPSHSLLGESGNTSRRGFRLRENVPGQPRTWASRTIPKTKWTVHASIPVASVAAIEESVIARTIAVGILVMLFASALAVTVYMRITRSLDWLAGSAEAALQGRATGAVPSMPTEIRRVANQIHEAARLRKDAEDRLIDANTRFATIASTAGYGIVVLVNPEGALELVNDAMAEMLGRSVPELLALPAPDLFADRAGYEATLGRHRRLGRGDGVEVRLKRADGSEVATRISWCTFSDRDGRAKVGVVVEDITRQTELERQFRHAQKMEAIGRLAAGIAHDYNNVLTVVNVEAELAIGDLDEDHPARTSVEAILSAGQRAAHLTQQLLDFSRPGESELRDFDLNHTVEGLTTMLRPLLGEGISLELKLAREALQLRGDPGQMEQVLMNLTINARDAIGDDGRIEISTGTEAFDVGRASVTAGAEPGRYGVLRVSDTGHGMDEETRQRIFEPFFTTKDAGIGTGLGLSTIYSIVQKAGGFITVESEVGSGTQISVFLPLADVPG